MHVAPGAERVWPPSAARWSVAVPNREGVAAGGATLIKACLCKNTNQLFDKFDYQQ